MFDRNELDFTRRIINEEIENPRIAKVEKVYEHVESDDDSNFEVDVTIDESVTEGTSFAEYTIPYNPNSSNSISTPRVGDTVIVDYKHGTDSKRSFAYGAGYTDADRAPLGVAGMDRYVYPAGTSPTGSGNIHFTAYTKYDQNPAILPENTSDALAYRDGLEPEETWLQFAKHDPQAPPARVSDTPAMKMEMYDSPTDINDESRITLAGNQVDGDDTQSMDATLDFKDGVARVEAEDGSDSFIMEIDLKNKTAELSGDGTNRMGLKLDFSTDQFTLIDGSGYGIESDGSGNFTWHHQSIDIVEDSTTSL